MYSIGWRQFWWSGWRLFDAKYAYATNKGSNLCVFQFKDDEKTFFVFSVTLTNEFRVKYEERSLHLYIQWVWLRMSLNYDQLKWWRLNWQLNNAHIRNLIIACEMHIAYFNRKIYCLLNLKKKLHIYSTTQWIGKNNNNKQEKFCEPKQIKANICI